MGISNSHTPTWAQWGGSAPRDMCVNYARWNTRAAYVQSCEERLPHAISLIKECVGDATYILRGDSRRRNYHKCGKEEVPISSTAPRSELIYRRDAASYRERWRGPAKRITTNLRAPSLEQATARKTHKRTNPHQRTKQTKGKPDKEKQPTNHSRGRKTSA